MVAGALQLKPKQTRRGAIAAAWLLGAAIVASGCSASGEHTSTRAQAIAGGKPDYSHANVFLLASHFKGSGGLCTATLIAPNLLLTARHCVSPSSSHEGVLCGDAELGEPYPPSAFAATNDTQPRENSPLFHAVEVRVPDIGSDTCGFDIAFVILDQNVPTSLAEPAVPRIDREVEPGEIYTAVGYGENDAGLPTATRLERQGLSIACQPGSCGDGVESTEFLGETGICSGDSGGPALDADGKVVGVVSRGAADCDTPIYGTVTAWYDLIVETATHAASLGNYEPPFWVTSGSSDPPLVVGSGGASGTGGADGATAGSAEEPYGCRTTTDCADGLVCQVNGETSSCVSPPPRVADSGGCSLGAQAPGGFAAALLCSAVALFTARRRRR